MENPNKQKYFYNFKNKEFIVKDIDFDMHNKQAWKSIEEKPSRKENCYFIGEMSREDYGLFRYYIGEKIRIGVRDEPLPALPILLKYFAEWKASSFRS
jgi:hypothetical protein